MTWLNDKPIATCGENLLVSRFRVAFIFARKGDEHASQQLEETVAELASRDIATTRQLRPYLARFMTEAANEMCYEEAAVCRDMLVLYDRRVLSNH